MRLTRPRSSAPIFLVLLLTVAFLAAGDTAQACKKRHRVAPRSCQPVMRPCEQTVTEWQPAEQPRAPEEEKALRLSRLWQEVSALYLQGKFVEALDVQEK